MSTNSVYETLILSVLPSHAVSVMRGDHLDRQSV